MNVLETAQALGYTVGETGHDVSPCPACKQTTRHRKSGDKRGAVGVQPRTLGTWSCFQCPAGGTSKDFMAYHTYKKSYRSLSSEERRGLGGLTTLQPSVPTRPAPPRYLSSGEVDRYVGYLLPLYADTEAQAYLQDRWGQPLKAERLRKLKGVWGGGLTSDCEPDWAKGWFRQKRRIHVGLYDTQLYLRSVVARSVGDYSPKGVSPTGYSRSGLFMYAEGQPNLVVIAEGELDFLAWALLCEQQPTVVGVVSGSITEELVTYVLPRYAHVVVATDWDEQGDAYYEKIRKFRKEGISRWKQQSKTQQTSSSLEVI